MYGGSRECLAGNGIRQKGAGQEEAGRTGVAEGNFICVLQLSFRPRQSERGTNHLHSILNATSSNLNECNGLFSPVENSGPMGSDRPTDGDSACSN